jgi:hypothetical protein
MTTQKYLDLLIGAGNIPLNKPWIIFVLFVLLELIYIALIITIKKDKKDDWIIYTLYAKLFALILLLLFIIIGWLLLIFIIFILMILEKITGTIDIIKVFSFIGILVVWFIGNYLLAKGLGNEEKEEPQIKKEVKKRGAGRKR